MNVFSLFPLWNLDNWVLWCRIKYPLDLGVKWAAEF